MKMNLLALRLSHFISLRSEVALMSEATPYRKSQSDDPQDIPEVEEARCAMICGFWINKVREVRTGRYETTHPQIFVTWYPMKPSKCARCELVTVFCINARCERSIDRRRAGLLVDRAGSIRRRVIGECVARQVNGDLRVAVRVGDV